MTRRFVTKLILWVVGVGCWSLGLYGTVSDVVPDIVMGGVGSALWGVAILLPAESGDMHTRPDR